MRVRPADTERRHTRAPRPVHLGPGPRLRQQLHRAGRPVHVRRRRCHVQRLRQHAFPHRHDHLDHTGDTGRGLRVAEVRLDRTQEQRPLGVAVLPVRGQQGLGLDRVAEWRARTVPFDDVHVRRGESGRAQGPSDHPLLRGAVRGGEAVGRAVLVDRGPAHHGQDLVPLAAGVRQPFQDEYADALGPACAVSGVREGLAPAVGRQAALAAELHQGARGGHDVDAAGECQRALAGPQGLRRHVEGHQGRGARRVHGHRRALQAQGVGEPAGGGAGGDARADVAGGVRQGPDEEVGVVLAIGADEDAGLAAAQRHGVDSGALERLPGRFEQQALLWVHRHGFARRDAEEVGVEVRDAVEESALLADAVAALVDAGVP